MLAYMYMYVQCILLWFTTLNIWNNADHEFVAFPDLTNLDFKSIIWFKVKHSEVVDGPWKLIGLCKVSASLKISASQTTMRKYWIFDFFEHLGNISSPSPKTKYFMFLFLRLHRPQCLHNTEFGEQEVSEKER